MRWCSALIRGDEKRCCGAVGRIGWRECGWHSVWRARAEADAEPRFSNRAPGRSKEGTPRPSNSLGLLPSTACRPDGAAVPLIREPATADTDKNGQNRQARMHETDSSYCQTPIHAHDQNKGPRRLVHREHFLEKEGEIGDGSGWIQMWCDGKLIDADAHL